MVGFIKFVIQKKIPPTLQQYSHTIPDTQLNILVLVRQADHFSANCIQFAFYHHFVLGILLLHAVAFLYLYRHCIRNHQLPLPTDIWLLCILHQSILHFTTTNLSVISLLNGTVSAFVIRITNLIYLLSKCTHFINFICTDAFHFIIQIL